MSDSYEFKVKVSFDEVKAFSFSSSAFTGNYAKIVMKDNEHFWFDSGYESPGKFIDALNEYRRSKGLEKLEEDTETCPYFTIYVNN